MGAYLAKLVAIESELVAVEEQLTAELAKPATNNPTTAANRYIFAQKALRLEDLLKHLRDN